MRLTEKESNEHPYYTDYYPAMQLISHIADHVDSIDSVDRWVSLSFLDFLYLAATVLRPAPLAV